jgi:CBS domain containing-hemolysin-like protein
MQVQGPTHSRGRQHDRESRWFDRQRQANSRTDLGTGFGDRVRGGVQDERKGVGAILIRNSQDTVDGIFTERDLMTRVVNAGRDAKTTAIGTVMSLEVRRMEGWTSLEDALSVMVVHGYRHLLVEDAGKIKGIVSIRDLMAAMVIPDTPMAHEGRAQVARGDAFLAVPGAN